MIFNKNTSRKGKATHPVVVGKNAPRAVEERGNGAMGGGAFLQTACKVGTEGVEKDHNSFFFAIFATLIGGNSLDGGRIARHLV